MEILLTLYTILKVLALIISSVFLVIAVYAYLEHKDFQKHEEKHFDELFTLPKQQNDKRARFDGVEAHIRSPHQNDWKVAILEADALFDEILKYKGFKGATMGDRLKAVSRTLLPNIDAIWSAHRLRNRVAHEGGTYELSERDAKEAIDAYRMALKHFHLL